MHHRVVRRCVRQQPISRVEATSVRIFQRQFNQCTCVILHKVVKCMVIRQQELLKVQAVVERCIRQSGRNRGGGSVAAPTAAEQGSLQQKRAE